KPPWDAARAKCQKAGSDLAVIDSPEENAELLAQITPTAESYLIGLAARQPLQSWGSSPVGDWVDGSSSSYRNFDANEPNQPLENAAARIKYQDGKWLDAPASFQTYPYLCEQTSAPALPPIPTGPSPQLVDIF